MAWNQSIRKYNTLPRVATLNITNYWVMLGILFIVLVCDDNNCIVLVCDDDNHSVYYVLTILFYVY